jgi:hypothetical protein
VRGALLSGNEAPCAKLPDDKEAMHLAGETHDALMR